MNKQQKKKRNRYQKVIHRLLFVLLCLGVVKMGVFLVSDLKHNILSKAAEISTIDQAKSDPSSVNEETLSKKEVRKPISITEKEGSHVYITFDDGPSKNTPALLDVLDKYNIKATFFVTAQFLQGQALEEMIKEISNRGHEVAVHTYSHHYENIYSSVDAYWADYQKMDDIIYSATGKRSSVFRFPGGSNTGYNAAIRKELIAFMKNKGLEYHDWNAYDGDNDGFTTQEMIQKAVTESSYTDHSVLLMHDLPGKEDVIAALPSIIEQLRQKGYTFSKLDETTKPIQFE